ncbi:hypothetical protein [Streptomyces sp. NP-1717]|uniref:hypothetical protein n=1 Tax=unclassified Streptomyces TaxID=2593676 RepID=UPI001F5CCEC0|nr:hypothetical protein [Streptomyces sp. NP-1717]MCI3222522.1 hypothetical protein [Streptomyces sp. NP-1717]WTA73822.1 hypothetical protein OG705_13565 [Streptomyces sp. NBC_00838]
MSFRKAVLVTFSSLALAGAGLVTSASAAPIGDSTQSAAAKSHGCESGYVCLYPGAGWNGDKPVFTYYKYGYYNLSNVTGTWRIYNNQTDKATMSTCLGYNGTRCEGNLQAGDYINKNMTPINSITLQR